MQTPSARFIARTLLVAVVTYLATALQDFDADGMGDWASLGKGVIGAVVYAVIGLITPWFEPFVGVKAKRVDVPKENARPV